MPESPAQSGAVASIACPVNVAHSPTGRAGAALARWLSTLPAFVAVYRVDEPINVRAVLARNGDGQVAALAGYALSSSAMALCIRWLLVLTASVVAAGPAKPEDPAEWSLQQILARSSAVGLVEITDVTVVDHRPGDGSLHERVTFKPIRGTGDLGETLIVTIEAGGISPDYDFFETSPNADQSPEPLIKPGQLKKGQQYWLAFPGYPQVQCSVWPEEYRSCWPDPVLAWWPVEGEGMPDRETLQALEKMIEADACAMQPQWVPGLDVVYEHKSPLDADNWYIRVRSDAKVLWEASVPGEKNYPFEALNRIQVADLELLPETKTNLYLRAFSRDALGDHNEFDLPPSKYNFQRWYEIESGRIAAVQVLRPQRARSEILFLAFSPRTGRTILERRRERIGPRPVDAWIRRAVRRYDPETGILISEEFYRLDQSGWTPIDADKAF